LMARAAASRCACRYLTRSMSFTSPSGFT
jgi:hypothetical protein